MTYRWNGWQKSALACWAGGTAIVLTAWGLFFFHSLSPLAFLAALLAGALVYATGNSLHKIGTGKERRDA